MYVSKEVACGLSIGTKIGDLEWPFNGVMAIIWPFSPKSVALLADYVKVVEDRPYII